MFHALNYIKPVYTTSRITRTTINEDARLEDAENLIVATQGVPVITSKIVDNLADQAIIVDVGKEVPPYISMHLR